jgi:hypothetical protein
MDTLKVDLDLTDWGEPIILSGRLLKLNAVGFENVRGDLSDLLHVKNC